jgi:predicted KAP-like P-loop ATPase
MNLMLDGVTPLLKSPRDLNRLMGMLRVTWPAVATEVDRADFVSIEALRLFVPNLYRAIRANPDRLTGLRSISVDRPERSFAAEYDQLFLAGIPEHEIGRVKRGLRRLFPRLDAVWSNVHHSSDTTSRRFRRICSADHFDTYFRFAIGDDVLPAATVRGLVDHAGDKEFIQSAIRRAVGTELQSGKTKGSVYLDELRVHAIDVAREHVGPLLTALFEIADELDVQADEGRGFYSNGDNTNRLRWLVDALLEDRIEQPERITILQAAMQSAQLYWACSFAERCKAQHKVASDHTFVQDDRRLVDLATADEFVKLARKRLRSAARDGSLVTHRRLFTLLWIWTRAAPKGLDEVRPVVEKLLKDDNFVLHLVT